MSKNKKHSDLQSFSIKNINKSKNLVGVGMVADGVITVGKSPAVNSYLSGRTFKSVIFNLTTKEIKHLISNLIKLV
jgi:hypothetical protein